MGTLRIELSKEVHDNLKIQAVAEGRPLHELVADWLERYPSGWQLTKIDAPADPSPAPLETDRRSAAETALHQRFGQGRAKEGPASSHEAPSVGRDRDHVPNHQGTPPSPVRLVGQPAGRN